jgi:hypothetical protein
MDPDMKPHKNHEKHLCYLQNIGFLAENLEEYKKLTRDPRFICKACGRVAQDSENLCLPEPL